MSTSIFMRSVGSLALTWGAMACAPEAPAERDTAAIDSVAAVDSAAAGDTVLARPADSAATGQPRTVQPRTAEPAEQSPITPIRTLPASGAIRDGRGGRGGRDSAMTPDFNDPAKRLPPAP